MKDDLFRQLKQKAAAKGQTMTSLIEEAIRLSLIMPVRQKSHPRKVHLTTFSGDGLQPGVDLDDSAGLLDLMEEADGTLRR